MVPSGPPNPIGGAQSVTPSVLRSNSGMLGGQNGQVQPGYSSLVSPRNQFGSMNMFGNVANVSSMLSQSYGNGIPNSGISGPDSSTHGVINTGSESDLVPSVGNGIGFNGVSSYNVPNMSSPSTSSQTQSQGQQFFNSQGNQLLADQRQQQLGNQNFQHSQQFSASHNAQQQQQQFQAIRAGLAGFGPVKVEPQLTNDQHGQQQMQQQQLQSMRSLGPVKTEPQQLQTMRSLQPVKVESQHNDQSLFLHQQHQQQQQFFNMSRQSPQATATHISLINQQRLLQLQQQQHQQQQLLKAMPQQRPQLQQQFPQQNLPMRSPVKPVYEPGICARRLTHYMYQQQRRPADNNIEFWRKFVAEYFVPDAKKKWCVSMYGSGRQTTGVFPQDVWHCEICNCKPGRGFEATVEVLPRLYKIKYESGTLEELLYVDMPREYQNSSGQIVLDYAKALQESVFEQLRVVREGQLRIVFSPNLKICSWEFCAWRHEELIPRRLLIPQVSQLGAAAQKYQAATQNSSSNLSIPDIQSNCNMFVSSARQLAKTLEVPLVNDLGYTKRYVRCLQISEVVNSMKDLIDYSRETGTGPMESLVKFPRRTSASSGFQDQAQPQSDKQMQQQTAGQNPNDVSSVQANMQLTASNGPSGMTSVNNVNPASTSTSGSTIVGLLHQNSMNSRRPSSMNNVNSPYGGNSVQIPPSPGSSSTIPQTQTNPSPFQSPTPSSNNLSQSSHGALTATNHMSTANSPANSPANVSMQQPVVSGEADPSDSQSSVQNIIHEMMMSNQLNGSGSMVGVGSLGNDVKNMNGIMSSGNNTGINGLSGNGIGNSNSSMGGSGFGSMDGLGQPAMVNGMRSAMGNNSVMNGRVGMASMAREQSMNHQHDIGSQILGGLGAVNGYNNNNNNNNNIPFDWKHFP